MIAAADIVNPTMSLIQEESLVTYATGYRMGYALLSHAGVSNARNETVWVLESVLGLSRLDIHVSPETPIDHSLWSRAEEAFRRRAAGEPLQYILGTQEFRGLDMSVRPGVLIPRPETELINEEVHTLFPSSSRLHMADVGTGSGCLAVSLASEFPNATILAMDCSEIAMNVAASNARGYLVHDRIRFQLGDGLEPLRQFPDFHGRFAVIVSNPPYIPAGQLGVLQREVRDFEPWLALDGGEDGLALSRRLLREAHTFLQRGGFLVLEIGEGQVHRICEEAEDLGIWNIQHIRRDGAGIDRVISLERKG